MHIHSSSVGGGRQHRLLTFARCHDAQLYALHTYLTRSEVSRLRATLDRLVEIGTIALFRIETSASEAENWEGVVVYLQEQIGTLSVDAAVGAAEYPATPTAKPQTLMPVWPFERLPDRPGVLTACGLFMGATIIFEALPVLDADLTKPVPEVAAHFDSWRRALGRDAMLGAVALPGSDRAHAVLASVRAG